MKQSILIKRAREMMYRATLKNGAPAWELTELVVRKGEQLARKYRADREVVITALYLAHLVFSEKIKGSIQKRHTILSARLAAKYLRRWKVSATKQAKILNAIESHHDDVPAESLEAEIMKNAECFKFLTISGALIYLHDLGRRGLSFSKAVTQAKYKVNQKFSYVSLPEVRREATKNYKKIMKLLSCL